MLKDTIVIRNGAEKDLDAFFELYWISSMEHVKYNEELDVLKSKEQCRDYIINRQRDYLKDMDHIFFVAEDGDKIVGIGTGYIGKRDEAEIYIIEKMGYIRELCIIPEYRKTGIGKKLLERLIQELLQKEVEFVGVGVKLFVFVIVGVVVEVFVGVKVHV